MTRPTRPPDTSSARTWLVLMKAHRALLRHAERSVAGLDMCRSDFVVLEMLLHKGPQRVNDIGRTISLTNGAITTAIDRLEARGHVTRGFDASDRRTRVVTLTPKGAALIRKAFGRHARAMAEASTGLTAAEHAQLVALLKKLGTSAQRQLDQESDSEGA
jgi:MarR family transcriptional regulator, 2-MHQ and catechol-resistance regulon repressor